MSSIGGLHSSNTHSGIDHHGHHEVPGPGAHDHDSGRLDEINAERGVGDDRYPRKPSRFPFGVNQRGFYGELPKELIPPQAGLFPIFAEAGAGAGRFGGRVANQQDYEHHAKDCEKKHGISYWEWALQLARNQDGIQSRFRFLNTCTSILRESFFLLTFDLTRLDAFQDARMEENRSLAIIKDFFPSDQRNNLSQELLSEYRRVYGQQARYNLLAGQIWTPYTERKGFTGFSELALNFFYSLAELRFSLRRSIESEYRSFYPPDSFFLDFHVDKNVPSSQEEGGLKWFINAVLHPHRSNALAYYPKIHRSSLLLATPNWRTFDTTPLKTSWWSSTETFRSRLWAFAKFLRHQLSLFPPRAIFSWIFTHLSNLKKLFLWKDHICSDVIQKSTTLNDDSSEYLIVFDQNKLLSLNFAPNIERFPLFDYAPSVVQALIKSSDKPWLRFQLGESRSVAFRIQRKRDFEAVNIPSNYEKKTLKHSFLPFANDNSSSRHAALDDMSKGWESIYLTCVHELRSPASAQLQTTQTIGAPQGIARNQTRKTIELKFNISSKKDVQEKPGTGIQEYERMHRLLADPLRKLVAENFIPPSDSNLVPNLENIAQYASSRARDIINSHFKDSGQFDPTNVYATFSGGKVTEANYCNQRAEMRTPLTTNRGGVSRYVDLVHQHRNVIFLQELPGNRSDTKHHTLVENFVRRTPSANRLDKGTNFFEIGWNKRAGDSSDLTLDFLEYTLELVKPNTSRDALNTLIDGINADFSLRPLAGRGQSADSRPYEYLRYQNHLFDDQRSITLKGRVESAHVAVFRAFLSHAKFSALLSRFLNPTAESLDYIPPLRKLLHCSTDGQYRELNEPGEERRVFENFTNTLVEMPQEECRKILGLLFQVSHQASAIQKYVRKNTTAPDNLRDNALADHPPPEAMSLSPTSEGENLTFPELDREHLNFLLRFSDHFHIGKMELPKRPSFHSWTKVFFDIIHEASRVARTFDDRPQIRAEDNIDALSDRWISTCGQIERLRAIFPNINNEIHMDQDSRNALLFEWQATRLELMHLLWPKNTIRERHFIEPFSPLDATLNRSVARTLREAKKIPEELPLLSFFVGGVEDLGQCVKELADNAKDYTENLENANSRFVSRLYRAKKQGLERCATLERHAKRLLNFLENEHLLPRRLSYWPIPVGGVHTNEAWEVHESNSHMFPLTLEQVGFNPVSPAEKNRLKATGNTHELLGNFKKPRANASNAPLFPIIASKQDFFDRKKILGRTLRSLRDIRNRFRSSSITYP